MNFFVAQWPTFKDISFFLVVSINFLMVAEYKLDEDGNSKFESGMIN